MDKNGLSSFLLGLGVGVGIGMLFALLSLRCMVLKIMSLGAFQSLISMRRLS